METPQNPLEATPLDSIPDVAWQLVRDAVDSARDAFHTPSLATTGSFGPAQRTVVLRFVDAERRLLACHADRRSIKVRELEKDARSSWLFYDRQRKLQLRFEGATSVHADDDFADGRWAATGSMGRACYHAGLGPGQEVSGPPGPPAQITSAEQERRARARFVVLACRVEFLDWLLLSVKGHRRAQFLWRDDALQGRWVSP